MQLCMVACHTARVILLPQSGSNRNHHASSQETNVVNLYCKNDIVQRVYTFLSFWFYYRLLYSSRTADVICLLKSLLCLRIWNIYCVFARRGCSLVMLPLAINHFWQVLDSFVNLRLAHIMYYPVTSCLQADIRSVFPDSVRRPCWVKLVISVHIIRYEMAQYTEYIEAFDEHFAYFNAQIRFRQR